MKRFITIPSMFLVVLSVFFVSALFVHAQEPSPNKIVNINFPCSPNDSSCSDISNETSIITYIMRFYNFGIAIVGIVAVGMIVAGGVYISTSGAVDKRSEGKDMITSAILGIVLLFGSYVLLRTVNPDLVLLKDPLAGQKPPPKTKEAKIKFENAQCGSVASSTDPNLIKAELPLVPGRSGYCKNRKVIATEDFHITDNDSVGELYYDENEDIPRGSTVWSYPYFIKGQNPHSTAKCLVYAYRPPENASGTSVTFIDLDPRLGVCSLTDEQNLSVVGKINEHYYGNCLEWSLKAKDGSGFERYFGPVPVDPKNFNYPKATNPPDANNLYGIDKNEIVGYTPIRWVCSKIDVSSLPSCASKTECASMFGTSPVDKNDARTDTLISTMRKYSLNLDSNYTINGSGANAWTYDNSNPICNQTRGNPIQEHPDKCSHAINSCHYGGGTGKDGALAIDFGGPKNIDFFAGPEFKKSKYYIPNASAKVYTWQSLIYLAIEKGGAKDARCENNQGKRVKCDDPSATHVHVTVNGCDKN